MLFNSEISNNVIGEKIVSLLEDEARNSWLQNGQFKTAWVCHIEKVNCRKACWGKGLNKRALLQSTEGKKKQLRKALMH